MPCFFPRPVFEQCNNQGVVFYRIWKPQVGCQIIREFKGRCGQCSGCRTKDSRNWAIRATHEAHMHEHNCFITLTVNQQSEATVFPGGKKENYLEFQKFMRRLRKKTKNKYRFIMCFEYGDQFERPHYHAIIFGWCPISEYRGDTEIIKTSPSGDLYSSRTLSELWEFGYSSVGYYDFGCAMYVAGYIHKKINGRLKDAWYQGRTQEFAHMSLKPGIGYEFYKKYTSDMYRRDKVELPGGLKFPIPRYYDHQHNFFHPAHMEKLKLKRMEPDPIRDQLNTPERLAARKVIIETKLKRKVRTYES